MFGTLRRLIDRIAGPLQPPLELCCPQGARNDAVARLRREGLHWGRLR